MGILTFMKREAQSEHLEDLCGEGLGQGVHSTSPPLESTYVSSGIILSFCTPDYAPKASAERMEKGRGREKEDYQMET